MIAAVYARKSTLQIAQGVEQRPGSRRSCAFRAVLLSVWYRSHSRRSTSPLRMPSDATGA